jgi:hypothetical protein
MRNAAMAGEPYAFGIQPCGAIGSIRKRLDRAGPALPATCATGRARSARRGPAHTICDQPYAFTAAAMIAHAISSWRTGALLSVARSRRPVPPNPTTVQSPGSPYRVVCPPAQTKVRRRSCRPPGTDLAAGQPRGSGRFVIYMKCKHTRRDGQRCLNVIAWL